MNFNVCAFIDSSTCSTYGPSAASPSDVSQLRPGDIGILGVIGKKSFPFILIVNVLCRGF